MALKGNERKKVWSNDDFILVAHVADDGKLTYLLKCVSEEEVIRHWESDTPPTFAEILKTVLEYKKTHPE